MDCAILDEAYERLHFAGPEWGGNLSNHGPMAAEVLVRRGHGAQVPRWVDAYVGRLDELPAPSDPITEDNWPAAVGDFRRVGDWTRYFSARLAEAPWREVLATWWPRLINGIAAGATHSVIRVGHVVRSLLAGDESPPAVAELAHALAYWAARSRTVPGVVAPAGQADPAAALAGVPRIPDQNGPIAGRLDRLGQLPGWPAALAALRPVTDPDDARRLLSEIVTAATLRYGTHGYGSPVLLVHAATAPNAVLHTLPALPRELWVPSVVAAWVASAAVTSTYGPADPAPAPAAVSGVGDDADGAVRADALDRAAAHGDEHVIKFTDTAAEVYERTGQPGALAAIERVFQLIPRPT
jgi:questin oxidase-like protein